MRASVTLKHIYTPACLSWSMFHLPKPRSLCLALVAWTLVAAPALAQDAGVEFFEKKVRPVLVANCFKCHSDQLAQPKSDLRVDSRAALLAGGARGPAIVPGEPEKSRLVEALRYQNVKLHMPPKGKLPDKVIADLAKWIQDGAIWPGGGAVAVRKSDFDLAKRKREHWAWQPVRADEPPPVKNQGWPASAVDKFILAKLEEKGLAPAAPADPRVLIRRLYFDLIGLPPAPDDIADFEVRIAELRKSPSSNESAFRIPHSAIEAVVDRLLASQHFGERWARHWLDLVRYAESRGHEFDHTLPNAWQYRDYVIRALNADLPYSQLVVEHIAGDLVEKPRLHTDGFNESILGTGFWFLGEEVHSPVDVRLDQADRFDNRIDVFSKTFLGLTVACARCHDHKFDAISTKDYYALFGYLSSSNYRSVRFDHWEHNRRIAQELSKLKTAEHAAIVKEWSELVGPELDRVADYLKATRALLWTANDRETFERVAKEYKVVPAQLERWANAIGRAAKEKCDPLHAWAVLAHDMRPNHPEQIRTLLKPVLARFRHSASADAVLDFSRSDEAWLADDLGFGSGPSRHGTPMVLRRGGQRELRFTVEPAAGRDADWDGLTVAPGTESDAGALAGPGRAGRTIRTPTFTIKSGKVHFRIRGVAQVYAAVAQHVMIAGPLHGRIVQQVKAGPEFGWHSIDLTAYKGIPVHLEFTAEDGADFALAAVVQGERPPEKGAHLSKLAAQLERATSLDAVALAYQEAMTSAVAAISGGKPVDAEDAALCDWLAKTGIITPAKSPETWLEKTVARFEKARKFYTQRIRKESRLALAIQDGPGFDEHVFVRGQPQMQGDRVPRRFLEALAGSAADAHTSGRLQLAQQVTDPRMNPLIARVFVNRVWHHLFGRGLVASVDNFGVLGELPTHPELLDYLADGFVKNGWSLKKLIRTLVLTTTYQQSSRADDRGMAADPQNLLLHHARIRRLEGEAIRDALLSISGRLQPTLYGPPVLVHLSPFQDGRGKPASGPIDGTGRRSIYLSVRRNFLSSFLLAFDTPTPFSTMGRRTVSNVPAQALILMNDPFVHEQAGLWAKRTLQAGDVDERIARMYLHAFARRPSAQELDSCRAFLVAQARAAGKTIDDAVLWTDLAHVLVNAKEFIFLN